MITQDISNRRLVSLGIAGASFEKPEDVVSYLVAVQSQDFAGAKWALGQRMRRAIDSDIEQAFNDGSILRTHVMRPTWHFVTPADIRWMLALTAPPRPCDQRHLLPQVRARRVAVHAQQRCPGRSAAGRSAAHP